MRYYFTLIFSVLFLCCASAQNQPHTPLEKALHKLGESLVETCPICVQQLRKEAFTILNEEFPAGKIISAQDMSSFQKYPSQVQGLVITGEEMRRKDKTDAGIEYELPIVIFRYHTTENHIAGIAAADFTDAKIAFHLKSLPTSKAFSGSVIAIPFRYGNGNTFSYSPKENILTVHCKVLTAGHDR